MQRVRNIRNPNPSVQAVTSGKGPLSCAVVSTSEYQRFQDLVDQPAIRRTQDANAEREELHKVSLERVAHWPNTIEAQRLKKERNRQDRLQKEEERRALIDKEEAELQITHKQEAIRKANVQLYDENDRVKAFNSKLFLATVLDEREKQIVLRAEKEKQQREIEKQWALVQQEQLRQAEEEEIEKMVSLKGKALNLKQIQLQQLDDIRNQKIAQRDNARDEGARIKKAAMDALEEERENEERNKVAMAERARLLLRANEENKQKKLEQLAKEKEEAELIQKFAAVKETQMQERKKRMDDKFKTKLEKRQALIEEQAQALEAIQNARVEKEMKAMRDFEKERDEREAGKDLVRQKAQHEILLFREAQRRRNEENAKREKQSKTQMQSVWRDRAELLIDEELDERRQQRELTERNQQFLLLQANEKKMQRARERQSEIDEGIQLQQAMKEEQAMYESYVNSVMGEYVRRGRGAALVQTAAKRSLAKSA